jgi:hypothetical protein
MFVATLYGKNKAKPLGISQFTGGVMMFNAIFNTISFRSWVLLVEETEVPREIHQPATSH